MKAFVITLSKIPSSLETATQMIEPLKSFGFHVELFEGTYGNDAERIFQNENRILSPFDHKGKPTTNNLKTTGPGVKGCFYSHYRLWQKCVEMNEPIFIFEDDVIFTYDCYHPVEFNELLIVAIGSWGWVRSEFLNREFDFVKAMKFNGSCLPGAVGYAIKPEAAKKLLKEYEKTYLPADSAINSSIINIEIHTHILGRALTKLEGKVSMTKTRKWEWYDE